MEIAISLRVDEDTSLTAAQLDEMLAAFAATGRYNLKNCATQQYNLQIPEQDILAVCQSLKALFYERGVGVALKVLK